MQLLSILPVLAVTVVFVPPARSIPRTSHFQELMAPTADLLEARAPSCPLTCAFDAVSRMPVRPHLKTRSRLQADLVQAALEQGQLAEAAQWIPRIENWRRGLALADVAVHHAELGEKEKARAAVRASEVFEGTIVAEEDQGWRRDRVRVRIAEAYALLGDHGTAAKIQASATPSEGGRLASMAVRTVEDKDVSKQMDTLVEIARTSDLEQIRFALLAMTEFYGRALRSSDGESALTVAPAEVEEQIRAAWTTLPIEPRIDILERLLDFEVASGTLERAMALAQEMSGLVTDHRWTPEQSVGLRGRAAGWLHKAGDSKAARNAANDALALYEASRPKIVSIHRGAALRPLAETFVALGDAATATAIYERALEEALVNPNSRPRAADLAMTAISALKMEGYEIPRSLLAAFTEVEKQIGAPW